MRDEICSLAEAIDELKDLKRDGFVNVTKSPLHKFPFGLWFRGHSTECKDHLEPRVFREKLPKPADPEQGAWDEESVYEHLRVRAPSHDHTYRSAFDWLCLMQHYLVPTRLLDWSESLLPALFFAVKDHAEEDGELIALNTYGLNGQSRRRPTIATPDDHDVIVRAEMATVRSVQELTCKKSILALKECVQKECRQVALGDGLKDFRKPIAVFPRRLNDRMALQSSVFTLHGGKQYPLQMPTEEGHDSMPSPVSLDDVDRESKVGPILRRYRIPHWDKKEIQEDLFRLGIHEASLFPEVDRQAVYLQQLWWFKKP
jgi:hypothetical protein